MDPRTIKLEAPPSLPAGFSDPFVFTSRDTAGWSAWRLWFTPSKFFLQALERRPGTLIALTAVTSGALQPLERRMFDISSNDGLVVLLSSSAVQIGAVGAMVLALVNYYIWGGLALLRLKLCGVAEPEPALARDAYMLGELVEVAPMLAWAGGSVVAGVFNVPLEIADVGPLVFGVSWVWAYCTHYVSARVLFGAPRRRTALVFFGLPVALGVFAVALELLDVLGVPES